MGVSESLAFVPGIPEGIESVQLHYKIIEGLDPKFDNQLNDMIGGVTTQICCLSSLFGPIIGGLMYDSLGYRTTMNANMFFQFWMLILFFSCNCGFGVCELERQRRQQMQAMRQIRIAVESVRGGSEV